MNKVPDTRWTRRVSWNTVRPGMSVFSKNTGPYRMISAPQYALFHTVVDLEALPTTTWGTHRYYPRTIQILSVLVSSRRGLSTTARPYDKGKRLIVPA